MDAFETYRVCKNCFTNTLSKTQPTLEKYRNRDGSCKTCGYEWIGINVGYYSPHRKWCVIRPRPFNSELSMCRNKMGGTCYRDWRCRRAHNQMELEIWIEDEKLLMNRKRPSKPKFGCVICRLEFRDSDNLNTHLTGKQHEIKTRNMWILPEVGSSIHYTGPIRTRPRLTYGRDSYELCRTFARSGRCQYGTGCRHAHSVEELKVWTDALTALRYQRQDRKYSSGHSTIGSATSEGGACRFPSGSVPPPQSWSKPKLTSSTSLCKTEGEPEHVKEVYRRISEYGIEPCLRDFPKHIKLTCDRSLTVTVEEHDMTNDIKWVFSLKTTQPEELIAIVLCDNKKIFSLGEVFKCSTRGSGRMEIKQKFVPNRTNYFLCQSLNQDYHFEVTLSCKPEVGIYKAQVVLQIQDEILVAKEVKVKTLGKGFKDICDNFQTQTKQPRVQIPMVEQLLKVNWEHCFEFINSSIDRSHPIPSIVEDKINSGFYDQMPTEICKEYYVKRFHTLLYFEEIEHKRSLMRYDLPDQKITFHSVEKQIVVERDYGRDYLDTARGDSRFLTLKLNHRLFEGYRSFRPPKLAYIIPNGTKKAYEYKICHMGADYVIILIHIDLIKSCQPSGGLALVRFSPERKDYVQMHESLDSVRLSVLFPMHRKVQVPNDWDIDHLLQLLEYEELSLQQKVAVSSIVDSKYQSYPTTICGPFGCGKTKTLSVAARLIARCFYSARILIVTKTNSSANLYVELLQNHFDTIKMYRAKQGNKQIMFRHFSFSRSLHIDEESAKQFANIEDGSYRGIKFFELESCAIVVTNLAALASLLPPRARGRSQSLFSHIFLDEAAQVIEPEACLALCMASDRTKIALAGDVYQTKPLILSKYGKQYGLDESLLQRFEQLPAYDTDALRKCKVELRENFRSQETIVKFLSELFYEDSLKSNPPSLIGPANYPALSFLHVNGDEQSLHGFPSYYNREEAELTLLALRKFVAAGVHVERIGVLSTHKAQVRLINEALRAESVGCKRDGHTKEVCIQKQCIGNHTINVRNLEGVQGREYDLIIVNTVRTLSDVTGDVPFEERVDLGLLDDVTQFNTILTRARGWVLVIGDMDSLLTVGECSHVWDMYIQACDDVTGLFRSREQFENFKMEKTVPGINTKVIAKEKSQMSTDSLDEIHSASSYDTKYNSLRTFMAACQEELEKSRNPDVVQTIQRQLNLAKIAMEAMESQRYTEQHSILVNYQISSDTDTVSGTELGSTSVCEYSQTVTGSAHGAALIPDSIQIPQQLMPQYPQDVILKQEYQK